MMEGEIETAVDAVEKRLGIVLAVDQEEGSSDLCEDLWWAATQKGARHMVLMTEHNYPETWPNGEISLVFSTQALSEENLAEYVEVRKLLKGDK